MEIMTRIAFIAFGGALGAVARYLISISPLANIFERFPLPTFVINVLGSFLLGFLLILLTDRVAISEGVRMGIIVGFLGAFTTFSTFEAEIYGLARERAFTASIVYMVLSVVVGFVALLAGIWLAKKV
jgi:CrcB protein